MGHLTKMGLSGEEHHIDDKYPYLSSYFERFLTAVLLQTKYYQMCSNVLCSFRCARIDGCAQRLGHS